MNLKVSYFYYVDNIGAPNINNIMDQHKNYKKYYEKSNDPNLFEPLDIDGILDVYNKRKKEFKEGGFFTDIFYIIFNLDNEESTNVLIDKTENDEKFRGWIKQDSDEYNYINSLFIGTGNLKRAFDKIKRDNKI